MTRFNWLVICPSTLSLGGLLLCCVCFCLKTYTCTSHTHCIHTRPLLTHSNPNVAWCMSCVIRHKRQSVNSRRHESCGNLTNGACSLIYLWTIMHFCCSFYRQEKSGVCLQCYHFSISLVHVMSKMCALPSDRHQDWQQRSGGRCWHQWRHACFTLPTDIKTDSSGLAVGVDINDLMQYGYMELRLIIEWARKVPGNQPFS